MKLEKERNNTLSENSNDNEIHIKIHRGQKEVAWHFQMLEEKNSEPRILHPAKISFKNEGKIKTFSDEGKLSKSLADLH